MAYSNPIVAGDTLVRDAIKSENYVQGVSGWAIFRDGNAEFNDIIARGDITADSVIVPFTNQLGEVYRIAIQKANVDQPAILFQFDGGGSIPDWDDGRIDVEAFTSANGWGETTWEPMQPDGFLLSNPPRIRIQSHRANGQAGRIDFLGSAALGDGSADDRPLIQVGSAFDVLIESLRHEHVEEATNLVLVGTGNADVGDGLCSFTGIYPRSGVVTINVYIRGSIDTANGIMGAGFEVRDTNSGGTVRHAFDGNKRAEIPRTTAVNVTGVSQYSETISGLPTSGVMFIRPIYIITNAATATYAHRTMDVIPSP